MFNQRRSSTSGIPLRFIPFNILQMALEQYQKALDEAPLEVSHYFSPALLALRESEVNDFSNYTSFLREHDEKPDPRMHEVYEYLVSATELFQALTKLRNVLNENRHALILETLSAVPHRTLQDFYEQVKLCYEEMAALAGNVILAGNVCEPGPKPSVKDIQLLTNFASKTAALYSNPASGTLLQDFYQTVDELPTKSINWKIVSGIVLLALGISLLVLASPCFLASLSVFNQVIWATSPASPIVGGVGLIVSLIGAAFYAGGSRQPKPYEFFYQNTFRQQVANIKQQSYTIREYINYEDPNYAMNQGLPALL